MRKNIWFMLTLALILPAMLFMVSCAKEEMATEPVATAPAPEPEAPADPDLGPSTEDLAAVDAERALIAARYDFENQAIYYEFDSAALLPSAQRALSDKAELLNVHSSVSATISGHCDERGTDAYNMALGQRRADAAKAFLVNLGVAADQLTTISYGEEQPADPGHDEAAWAKNRRSEFSID